MPWLSEAQADAVLAFIDAQDLVGRWVAIEASMRLDFHIAGPAAVIADVVRTLDPGRAQDPV